MASEWMEFVCEIIPSAEKSKTLWSDIEAH